MTEEEADTYGELTTEKDLVGKLKHFSSQIANLENVLMPFVQSDIYSALSIEDKIKYDIFTSYTLSSLYWMYVRTLGDDPFKHPVKTEVDRVQEYVQMYQAVKDRKKAPQLDKGAAKRFIRSGLFDPALHKPCGKRKIFDEDISEDDEGEGGDEEEHQAPPK